MVRTLPLLALMGFSGLTACQRQAVGGFLPVRAAAVRVQPPPVTRPIYRAVDELRTAIRPEDVNLPTLEQQLALAERRTAAGPRARSVATDSTARSQPSTGAMTSLADQLGVYGRGVGLRNLGLGSGEVSGPSQPGPHQPTEVDHALAKVPANDVKKANKAQRWKNTGSDLRPALLVLAAAVVLMVIGLK